MATKKTTVKIKIRDIYVKEAELEVLQSQKDNVELIKMMIKQKYESGLSDVSPDTNEDYDSTEIEYKGKIHKLV